MKNKHPTTFPPLVFNVFKPARMTSYDVVRHYKKHLPQGYGKIGHFGTLDPFASGVLMIGIGGAARLNDFIHDLLPKTYLAVGKLGIETPTGDYTSEISQRDDSLYLKQEIGSFSKDFIEEQVRAKFLGEYWQAPHKFSASKFMGRNMHQWAREGVEVKKEAVKRFIHDIQIVKYQFPYLSLRVTVSSGTYVRTLFSDMSHHLGTIGSLISLVRESVGPISTKTALHKNVWPQEKNFDMLKFGQPIDQLLPFSKIFLNETLSKAFRCGAFLRPKEITIHKVEAYSEEYFWVHDETERIIGLAYRAGENEIRPKINFYSEGQVSPS